MLRQRLGWLPNPIDFVSWTMNSAHCRDLNESWVAFVDAMQNRTWRIHLIGEGSLMRPGYTEFRKALLIPPRPEMYSTLYITWQKGDRLQKGRTVS